MPFIDGWEGMAAYTRNERDLNFMSNQNYDITCDDPGREL